MGKQTTGALHKAREALRALEAVEIAGVSLAYNSNPAASLWQALGDKPLLPVSTYSVSYSVITADCVAALLPYLSAKDELDAFMQAKQALDAKIKEQRQVVAMLHAQSWPEREKAR